jgi:hypothetical protein
METEGKGLKTKAGTGVEYAAPCCRARIRRTDLWLTPFRCRADYRAPITGCAGQGKEKTLSPGGDRHRMGHSCW